MSFLFGFRITMERLNVILMANTTGLCYSLRQSQLLSLHDRQYFYHVPDINTYSLGNRRC